MKILQLITQMEGAGPQAQAVAIAECLRDQGFTVKTVFLYQKRALFNKEPDTWSLLRRRPHTVGDRIKTLWRVWQTIRSEKPDAVFTFSHWSNALVPPLARLAGVRRVLATQTGLPLKQMWLPRLLDRLWVQAGFSTFSVATSQTCYDQFSAYPEAYRRRLRLIEPGVRHLASNLTKEEARLRFRLDTSAPLLLHVGRLSDVKNQTAILKALPQMPKVHVAFVGDGEMAADYKQLAARLDLEDRVFWLGELAAVELGHLYTAADVFVMPSLWESFGLPPIEAARAGLPLALADIQTFREITRLEQGDYAALFFHPQNPSALADTAQQLLANSTLRADYTARSNKLGQRYDIDRTTAAYVDLVKETL